jgi:tetratricopeptide (TPR) repeat protein
MALGFGFNKAKVLASAEKNVQSGKLQNAISDYEKILKEDPKDLTVLNTVGDLYARLGNNDQAVQYFKKVGDSYASEGFTVKAIAMYKKLTKLSAQPESILKLAELYTVQGLYNDARAQYVSVADQFLKGGRNDEAARIFQKILELDPENTAMQSRLADLYMKLGKKQEALQIYYSAAQTLYSKQSLEAADHALAQVLTIEPGNFDALLLRGTVAADMGKAEAAINYLKDVWDIDSRPDALRTLLRAHLQLKNFTEAQPIAVKLTTVHNDITGISTYADALLNAGKFAEALQLYDQYADRLLSSDSAAVVKVLVPVISKVKESAAALDALFRLFQKTGDNTHIPEVMELLAHACVQEGDLAKARDLYHMLAESEPENPLHSQNYKQVVAKLGEDAASRPLSNEQAGQAFMMDQLEHQAIVIQEQYPAELATSIRAALTDSELFDSYNLPGKAIPLLEKVYKNAPRDSQLNLRLETLYAKVGRFADAAKCATLLAEIYQQHGHPDEAKKQAEMAQQYQAQAAEVSAAAAAANFAPSSWDDLPMDSEEGAVTTEEAPSERAAALQQVVEQSTPVTAMDFDSALPAEAGEQPPSAEVPVESPSAVESFTASSVSSFEFESSGETAFQAAVPEAEMPVAAPAEIAEFGMVQEAVPAAAEPAQEASQTQVEDWESMLSVESPAESSSSFEPQVSEISFEQPIAAPEPEPPAAAEPGAADDGSVSEFVFESVAEETAPAPEPMADEIPPPSAQSISAPVETAPDIFEAEPEPVPAPEPSVAPADVAPLPPAPQVAAPPPPPPQPPVAAPPAAAASADDLLGDLVSGLEDVLGDVLGDQPTAPAPPAKAVPPAPAMTAPVAAPPAAAIAAAAPAPAPVASAPVQEIQAEATTSALADMFAEFKDDVEDSAQEAEDPDTHYNLGVAFKEMGLLDEAIGELQKVCLAIEHGHEFDQKVQAYTWLAQCLVDKGVPEASVRWYQKALKVPALPEESRLAIYYDMANAQEQAGDKKAAYGSFMEVYSSNIDFRDVADRIKALKS